MRCRPTAWIGVLTAVMAVTSLSCSASTRHRTLTVFFDGVPDPDAVDEAPQKAQRTKPVPSHAPAPSAATTAGLAGPIAVPLTIPPAPFEAFKTWTEVLQALPLAVDGGVDWVQAFTSGLVTPRLERTSPTSTDRPLTLDTLMDVVVADPRQPALDLDFEITPSVNAGFEAAPFFKVKFPHSSHTAWLGCSSCHPGQLSAKSSMLGILQGKYCGECHGRVSFAPQVSCGRCHLNLSVPPPEVLTTELGAAEHEAVPASEELLGRGAGVYKQMCVVCHGEAGNGAGPFSEQLDPKPRDFTAGKYKFRTTLPSSIPTDGDIYKVITRGVPGTSMPPFAALAREDRWALTHYIKSFSDRFKTSKPESIPVAPPPEVTPSVLEAGLGLYKEAGCDTCHGETGRGNGPSAPTLKDDWGVAIRPFNFASGRPMKGGSGPEAVYRTIMTGLQGTPMPGFGDALQPDQAWALTSYVVGLFDKDKQPVAVKGDIAFVRSEAASKAPDARDHAPVVFPHWFHRIRVKCASCHPSVFKMQAGANAITMDKLRAGQFCATCHNGKVAWEVGFTTCVKCHIPQAAETP